MSLGPFSGALGCRDEAGLIIDHPEHGERVVCDACADGHEIVADLEDDEDLVVQRATQISQRALGRSVTVQRELDDLQSDVDQLAEETDAVEETLEGYYG